MYPEIEFFAVSCDSNEQLCEQHDIQMYPSLRLFKSDDGPTSMGIAIEFDAEDIEKKEDESTPRKIADLLEITSVSVGIAKNKVGEYRVLYTKIYSIYYTRRRVSIIIVNQNAKGQRSLIHRNIFILSIFILRDSLLFDCFACCSP